MRSPRTATREKPLPATTRESLHTAMKTPAWQKKKKNRPHGNVQHTWPVSFKLILAIQSTPIHPHAPWTCTMVCYLGFPRTQLENQKTYLEHMRYLRIYTFWHNWCLQCHDWGPSIQLCLQTMGMLLPLTAGLFFIRTLIIYPFNWWQDLYEKISLVFSGLIKVTNCSWIYAFVT